MNTTKPKLIIVSGPTACGKTATSIKIANHIKNTHGKKVAIVNFDSLLFYKELNIGTAKPTPLEMCGIKHYLVDNCSIDRPLNASDYCALAFDILEKLKKENIIAILVGGSGFYLRALIKGMYESPPISKEERELVQQEYQTKGIGYIREFLKEFDLDSYNTLHENDHYRNIRAYEHYKVHKTPFSLEKKKFEEENPYNFTNSRFNNWDILHFYLNIDKTLHQEIIKKRTMQMIQEGLIEEVSSLLNSTQFTGAEKALASIGYKETLQYLDGQFASKDDYIERICISTRQLAKAQRTFFNKVTPKIHINPIIDEEKVYKELDSFI